MVDGLILPGADEQSVQAQLRQLDSRLILTRERDGLGRDYYVVIFYEGGTVPPSHVLDWREMDDEPRPLSSGLVHEVGKMMADGPVAMIEIVKRNEALKAQKADEFQQVYEDLSREFERAKGRLGVVHRSPGLAAARRRGRRRGTA